jgi:hypothetical protein
MTGCDGGSNSGVRDWLFVSVRSGRRQDLRVRNITAAERTYRLGILTGFVTLVVFTFLVESLYELLKDVDKSHAMLMVLLVSIGVAVALANMLSKFAAGIPEWR